MFGRRSLAEPASNSSMPCITASLKEVSPPVSMSATLAANWSVLVVNPDTVVTSSAKVTIAIWSPARDWFMKEVAAALA